MNGGKDRPKVADPGPIGRGANRGHPGQGGGAEGIKQRRIAQRCSLGEVGQVPRHGTSGSRKPQGAGV